MHYDIYLYPVLGKLWLVHDEQLLLVPVRHVLYDPLGVSLFSEVDPVGELLCVVLDLRHPLQQ